MELHQIRYFLKACETLNFTRAAEQCGVSVPSLSRAIHTLEEELGGQLFRRERHLTHLTDLGRLMQMHLSTIDKAADAAKRDAKDYSIRVSPQARHLRFDWSRCVDRLPVNAAVRSAGIGVAHLGGQLRRA